MVLKDSTVVLEVVKYGSYFTLLDLDRRKYVACLGASDLSAMYAQMSL